jgi:hypothetical protein
MRRYLLLSIALLGLGVGMGCEASKRFVIRSMPPGAKVVIDNQPLPGKTPLDHALEFRKQGQRHETHLVRVFRDGYYEDSWEVHHADAPDLLFLLVKKPGQ